MNLNLREGIMGACIVMGVSGCGKSTLAKTLAKMTDGIYLDADDFHPAENKDKMRLQIPLTDDDRCSWLNALNQELKNRRNDTIYLACSALREIYRQQLSKGLPDLHFVYLKGSKELIRERINQRIGHYMPASLLDSQFEILEEPLNAVIISADQTVELAAVEALKALLDRA